MVLKAVGQGTSRKIVTAFQAVGNCRATSARCNDYSCRKGGSIRSALWLKGLGFSKPFGHARTSGAMVYEEPLPMGRRNVGLGYVDGSS